MVVLGVHRSVPRGPVRVERVMERADRPPAGVPRCRLFLLVPGTKTLGWPLPATRIGNAGGVSRPWMTLCGTPLPD